MSTRRAVQAPRAGGGLVDIGGLHLWVETAGQGPPVLMLAGLGYASWCWQGLAAALAPAWGPIVMDNRGTGRSDKPKDPFSIADLADDAAAVLDRVADRPVHVIGHSMGGYIAMQLAIRHPDRVRSLVLVCTMAGGRDAVGVPVKTLAAWNSAAMWGPEEFARRTMPLSLSPGWPQAHPDSYRRMLEARLVHPTPLWCWMLQFQACADFLAEGIEPERLAVPATILHGTADQVVPFENAERLHRRIASSRVVPLAGAGHLCFLEQPDRFVGVVQDHLAACHPERG